MDASLDKLRMPQELAQKLFAEGAFIIMSGVPQATEVGIDLSSQKIGEMFRGFKMVPAGPHFVFTSADKNALRVGFIHYFHKGEVLIREWNEETEELRPYTKPDLDQQIVRIKENIKEVDKFLAPYDFEGLPKWQCLTNELNEDVVNRVSPENGIVRSSAEYQSCPDSERPKGSSPLQRDAVVRMNQSEEDLLPNLAVVPGTVPRFTEIPSRHSKNATPAEVSMSHLDSVQAIDAYFSSFVSGIEAIQEIQISFALYLTGWSVESLAHWRKLLSLLSNSETAVTKYRQFYVRYLEILRHQIPELPEELMTSSEHNTVYKDVGKLIRNCSIAGLRNETDMLRMHLVNLIYWNFDDFFEEDPEDLPVVVEI